MTTEETIAALRAAGVRICSVPLDDGTPFGDDPTSNTRRHVVALEGEWDGHWQGTLKVDRSHLEQMVANFEAVKTDAVVDYEHSSLNPFVGQAPAAGWINDLQIRDSDTGAALVARIAWTQKAADHIRDREYRYLSPVIAFRTKDRRTGQDLGASVPSVALTNTPFLDELPEVTLNSIAWLKGLAGGEPSEHTEDPMNVEQTKALALTLGLAETAGAEDITQAVKDVAEDAKALSILARAVGIEEGAEGAKIAEAVTALSTLVKTQAEELATLRAGEAEAKAAKSERLVEQATAEGKIVASNRGWALKLAQADAAAFSEWASAAPAIVPTDEVKPPKRGERSMNTGSSSEPTADDIKRLCSIQGVKDEAAAASISAEAYVKANFHDLAEQYA